MRGVWRQLALAAAAVVYLASAAIASAQPAAAAKAAAPPAQAEAAVRALDPADIEAFLDGLVPLQIETNDIAGVTISIVKGGKVIFAKGYGYADVEAKKPVTPDTMFRVGSITKLSTWASVMQLVEQGKLDLDADVNKYLDFEIAKPFGKPVTLRNLMTHRGGFQESIKNLGAQNSGKVDLGKYVRENIPSQIFEPGTTPSYSNYGAALAGYIVERVAGVPFDTYAEENIYKPLGMTRTSLRAPLPKELEADMSKGYGLGSGAPIDFEILNGYPAGSQSSSATDMTKFMLAFLNGGALGDRRILKAETVAAMFDTVTALDERQNGIALGFYEAAKGRFRTIGHGGDTIAFHSDMHLIPSESFGFFVSYNSTGRGDTPPRAPLWRKFRERYFAEAPDSAKAVTESTKDIVGSYITTRRADTSLLKLFGVLNQATVSANEDGTITVDTMRGLNGQLRRWEPLGNGEFRATDGRARLIFKPDSAGRMMMLPASAGVAAFQRAEPQDNPILVTVLLVGALAVLAINMVAWPFGAAVRRHYGIKLQWNAAEQLLRLFVMLTSAALLVLFIGHAVVLSSGFSDPWRLDSSLDEQLKVLQLVGFGGVLGSFFVIVNAIQSWFNDLRGFSGRVKETVVALCCVALIWLAWSMNLFDQTLRF